MSITNDDVVTAGEERFGLAGWNILLLAARYAANENGQSTLLDYPTTNEALERVVTLAKPLLQRLNARIGVPGIS